MGYDRTNVGGIDAVRVTGFFGTIEQRTDQDRIPTADARARHRARRHLRQGLPDPRDRQQAASSRASSSSASTSTAAFGLEAHDILIQYDLAGNVVSETDNLSIDSAQRVDTGFFFQGETPAWRALLRVRRRARRLREQRQQGGYFGDRSVSNGAVAGFGRLPPVRSRTRRSSRRSAAASATRRSRIASFAVRAAAASSPAIRISSRRRACSSTWVPVTRRARFRAAGYFYHYRIKNLIERYPTTTDRFFEFRNRGEAEIRGFEVEMQAESRRTATGST